MAVPIEEEWLLALSNLRSPRIDIFNTRVYCSLSLSLSTGYTYISVPPNRDPQHPLTPAYVSPLTPNHGPYARLSSPIRFDPTPRKAQKLKVK